MEVVGKGEGNSVGEEAVQFHMSEYNNIKMSDETKWKAEEGGGGTTSIRVNFMTLNWCCSCGCCCCFYLFKHTRPETIVSRVKNSKIKNPQN